MEEACNIIERIVNEQIKPRKRFPLEWDGDDRAGTGSAWRANVAASNCYEGSKESVGYHSDQMTYLGPYSTIASLSLGPWPFFFVVVLGIDLGKLGTQRVFSLREVVPTDQVATRKPRTFNVPLPHNSVCMHGFSKARLPVLTCVEHSVNHYACIMSGEFQTFHSSPTHYRSLSTCLSRNSRRPR